MGTLIRYTLLTAFRDWLFLGMSVFVLLAFGLAHFMGGTALVEQTDLALVYFAGIARMVVVVGLIVFVCFHVRRAFDNREIEATLSKPISRCEFVVGYFLGFFLLSFFVVLPVALLMFLFPHVAYVGLAFWVYSLLMEVAMVVAFALLCGLVMKSAVSAVLSSFAFYVLCRLMGFFVTMFDKPMGQSSLGFAGNLMEMFLRFVSMVVPRLDLYSESVWVIRGAAAFEQSVWVVPLQALVYVPLLLFIAFFDVRRKQF